MESENNSGHQSGATATANRPSMLAIGDIFTDAFIKLNEEVARVDTDPDGSKRLSLPLGSKPPYDKVDIIKAVGPSPNAAVSAARLDLDVSLLAWLGDDQAGREALGYLRAEGISTGLVSVKPGIKSNYYYVLRYGAERTILVKDENFDYQWQVPSKKPDWIYLSLISDKSWQLHEDLLKYLTDNQDVKFAFQPGTFHFKWGKDKLAGLYHRSNIVVLNVEEAVDVTGRSKDSIDDLLQGLHELGPQVVVVTDGPNGAYASDGSSRFKMPLYPDPVPPVDRTGAGDAFASTFVATLAKGHNLESALQLAPINSMSVCQKVGAQAGLLTEHELEEWLKKAPDWYHVESF
ncbi:MAG TPA: carbohydrate kinase family protein [Verrucomicrobiae bacterium]|nr:carbohydrate kinase family protein [Verrucomicrobiae bacterium]